MHLPVWNWHRGVNVTLSELPSRHPKPACETARVDVSMHFFSACVSLLILWVFPCLCKRGKPRGLGCMNAANFNFVVGFVTILGICLTEQKALHRRTRAPARTKALVAFYVIIHQVFDMNLPLSSHSVRRKKNNWAHYLSSLWHIRFIIFLQRLPV